MMNEKEILEEEWTLSEAIEIFQADMIYVQQQLKKVMAPKQFAMFSKAYNMISAELENLDREDIDGLG